MKGVECVEAPCVTCTPCQPGFYKAAVSTDPCEACPANTYVETEGSTALSLCYGMSGQVIDAGSRRVRAAGEHAPATRSTT